MPTLKSLVLLLSTFILSIFPTTKLHTSHANLPPTMTVTPISQIPTILPTVTPTPEIASSPFNSQFIYPQASVISSSGNNTTLKSSDDPATIVNWYQKTFTDNAMQSVTSSLSNANNNVTDMLIGDNGSVRAQIKIQKNADDTATSISVTISQSSNQSQSSGNVRIENNIFNSSNTY